MFVYIHMYVLDRIGLPIWVLRLRAQRPKSPLLRCLCEPSQPACWLQSHSLELLHAATRVPGPHDVEKVPVPKTEGDSKKLTELRRIDVGFIYSAGFWQAHARSCVVSAEQAIP